MSEVMDVINAFGTPLKVAWVAWIGWGVGQYFWFRHERSLPTFSRPAAAGKPVVKKQAAPKPIETQAAEAPVMGRLITPTHVTKEPKAPAPVAAAPVFQAPVQAAPIHTAPVHEAPAALAPPVSMNADAPVFDPSKAVIETFGAAGDESPLDKFVRDFEMQDARPTRRRTRPITETPSYGAEAPHTT